MYSSDLMINDPATCVDESLKNTLSKTLRSDGIAWPHWQKGFFDHVLRSEESYENKWHYVRENPVRAGLVQDWTDWPFSGEIFDLRSHAGGWGFGGHRPPLPKSKLTRRRGGRGMIMNDPPTIWRVAED